MQSHPFFNRKILLLLLLIALGIFLRFYRQDELGTFRGDQAIELSGARDILSGKLTLIGIKTSNSEVRNGAVMYYLLAPILKLTNHDPIAGGILQSLLSLGTIMVIWHAMSKSSTPSRVLVAFLIATSPLLVVYSRQTLLAFYPLFFFSLIFWCSVALAQKYSRTIVFVMGCVLGFSLQIHYSTLCLVLFCTIFPWIFLTRTKLFSYYLTVLGGFLLGFSPMLAFELRHEFFNTKMFWQLMSSPHEGTFGLGSIVSLGQFWTDTLSRLFFAGNHLLSGVAIIVVIGLVVAWRRRLGSLEKLCLALIGSTVVFTLFFNRDLHPSTDYSTHYALASIVPIFIIMAFIVRNLRISDSRPPIILTAVAVLSLVVNFPSYRLTANNGYSSAPGWSLNQVKLAANLIKKDVADRKYNVSMLVDGENRGLPLRYFLDELPNKPLGVENYAQAENLYVVIAPGLVLNRVSLWEIDAFGQYEISRSWDLANAFRLHKLSKVNNRQ